MPVVAHQDAAEILQPSIELFELPVPARAAAMLGSEPIPELCEIPRGFRYDSGSS
jgi:hypothetical protein